MVSGNSVHPPPFLLEEGGGEGGRGGEGEGEGVGWLVEPPTKFSKRGA